MLCWICSKKHDFCFGVAQFIRQQPDWPFMRARCFRNDVLEMAKDFSAASSVFLYTVDNDGLLTKQQTIKSGGEIPWSFGFDSHGKYIICGNLLSHNLSIFQIGANGNLSEVSKTKVSAPIGVRN